MKKFVLAFLILTIISFGQDYTKWQNYFSYNQVNAITGTTGEFWAATEGGAFYYNAAENKFTTMSIVEGLSSNNLNTITKDGSGNIWFGTENGIINIYEPKSKTIKKIFDIYNSDKPEKGINQIVVNDSTAYIATDFGISLVNTNTRNFGDTYRKFGNFSAEIKTYHILIENGKLYVATESGVAILNDNSPNPSAPEAWTSYSVNGKPVFKLIKYNSELIACTDDGLYKFNGSDWNSFQLAGTEVKDMTVVNNSLRILTAKKLYKYDTSLSEISLNLKSSKISLNKFLFENESSFLICSDSGVVKNGNIENVIVPNGPLKNSFLDIDIDTDGNLFVGTGISGKGSGVFHLDKTIWKNYNLSNSSNLVSIDIHKVYCAPDGKAYFMSWGNGFSILENNEMTKYTSGNTNLAGIAADQDFVVVSDIEHDSNDDAWILTYLSHNRKDISVRRKNGEWHHYQLSSAVTSLPVETKEIEIDRHNTKWFIAKNKLCFFNNNGNFTDTSDDIWGVYTSTLSSKVVNCIEVDDRGDLWVGTTSGLYILSQTNKLASASIKEVLVEAAYRKNISAIEVDALNQKWVVTDQGLVLLSQDGSKGIEAFSTENSPLPSNEIQSLTFENKTGLLYIATNEGLLSYKTTAVEPEKQFSNLFVYPNPFIIGQGTENIVTIDGLIKDTEIKILSVSGELVREFQTPGGRIATWDGKDENGEYVGSGVYIVVAYDKDGSNVETAKIAVLRK